MAITHSTVKVSGDLGTADDWNANHVVDDDSKPKNFTTLIVAASNSLDTTRADYVCDGIDDQDTINAAMAALPAGGGRISLLEGIYDITNTITFDKDNVTIQGLGRATIIQTASDVLMVYGANKTGLLIQDVRLIGSGAGNTNNIGIRWDTITYSAIRGCWIEDMGSDGIYLDYASNFNLITNNIMSSNDDVNIDLVGSASVTISGNILYESGTGDSSLVVHSSQNCILTGNTIIDADNDGILLYGSSYVIITGNTVSGSGSDGITLTNNSDYNTVTTNNSYNNTTWDIFINGPTNDKNIVIGNIMVGTGGGLSDTGTNTEAAHNQV